MPALSVADVHDVLAAAFPAQGGLASLEYVETVPAEGDGISVVVRLVVWDIGPAGTKSIRDVKEQQVWFDLADSTKERLTIYVRALVAVLSRALAVANVDLLMPHNLLVSSPLKLKAQTEEQFVKALSMRSRLGKYLAPARASTAPFDFQ